MTAANDFSLNLRKLAVQTVLLRPKSSVNNFAEPSYTGSTTSYKARVQKVTTSGADLTQDPFQVGYTVYIPSTTVTVALDDEITLPDGKIRPIVSVDVRADEYGQQAVVLSVGK
jgi:hypothetical protein